MLIEVSVDDLQSLFSIIERHLVDIVKDVDEFYTIAPVMIKLRPIVEEAAQRQAKYQVEYDAADQEKQKTKLVTDLVLDGVKQAAIKSELGMGDFYNDPSTKDKVDALVRRFRKNPENNTMLLDTIEEAISDSVGNSLINAEDDAEQS